MEKIFRTIAKNSIWMGLAQLSDKILTVLIFIICAKVLGPKNFGEFMIAFSVCTILSVLYNLGLALLFVRDGSKNRAAIIDLLINMLLLQFCLIVIVVSAAFLFIPLFSYSKLIQQMIYILLIGGGALAIGTTLQSFFQAIEQMFYVTIIRFVTKLGWLVAILFFLYWIKAGVVSVTVAYMLGAFGGAFVGAIFVKSVVSKEEQRDQVQVGFRKIYNLFYSSLSLALMGVIVSCYSRADVLIISFLRGDYQVGIYSGAYKIYEASVLVSGAFLTAIFPQFVQYGITDQSIQIFMVGLKLMLIAAFICVAFVFPFANYVVLLIYGKSYLSSAPVLQILIWAVIFSFSSHLILYYLISCHMQKIVNIAISAVMILNVILNLLFVSRYGIYGAAITMIISEALLAIAFFYVLNKKEIISYAIYKDILGKTLFAVLIIWINSYVMHHIFKNEIYVSIEVVVLNVIVSIFLLLYYFPNLKRGLPIMNIINEGE